MPANDITDDSRLARAEAAIASEVEGEAVILDIESGYFFRLNPIGSRIWWALETETSLPGVCARLQETFAVSPQTCRADVLEFLGELKERGLISVS